MFDIVRREAVYLWYYFSVQLEQIFGWWVLGMAIGSAISVFAKDKLHALFASLSRLRPGALGGPCQSAGHRVALMYVRHHSHRRCLCRPGIRQDWLAAFICPHPAQPQLSYTAAASWPTALWWRIISCLVAGVAVAGART